MFFKEPIQNLKQKIEPFLKAHRKTSVAAGLGIVLIIYFGFKIFGGTASTLSYVMAPVEKGTLVASVSGTGQISVSDQIDIKPKASGYVSDIKVMNGQEVKANALLVQLKDNDAYKAVRDAKANLESAQLSLEKLKQPATDYEILQAENALTTAKNSLEKLKISQPADYQEPTFRPQVQH